MSKQGKVLGRSQNGIFSHGLNSYQKNIYGGGLGNGIELKPELPELGAVVFFLNPQKFSRISFVTKLCPQTDFKIVFSISAPQMWISSII